MNRFVSISKLLDQTGSGPHYWKMRDFSTACLDEVCSRLENVQQRGGSGGYQKFIWKAGLPWWTTCGLCHCLSKYPCVVCLSRYPQRKSCYRIRGAAMRRRDRQTSMSGYNHLSLLNSPSPLQIPEWCEYYCSSPGSFRTCEIWKPSMLQTSCACSQSEQVSVRRWSQCTRRNPGDGSKFSVHS